MSIPFGNFLQTFFLAMVGRVGRCLPYVVVPPAVQRCETKSGILEPCELLRIHHRRLFYGGKGA